jgi:sugar (pentulose or hexulose) kinase
MHIAIFDIGKTNKKLLVFDEQYRAVYEEKIQLQETADEDGFPCEDILALTQWMKTSFAKLVSGKKFDIRALNIAAYGASLVYIDEAHNLVTPLYNYLKPYPQAIQEKFYEAYGGKDLVAAQTASPVLGSLNAGLQLYRLKEERPEVFKKIRWALHLPQYLAYIFSGGLFSDITSIGCHTQLWDFNQHQYHRWVRREGVERKLPPVLPAEAAGGYTGEGIAVGTGLHDSSAALVPYLSCSSEPFILLSTGTWCISLNPFNDKPLTIGEMNNDVLCYLSCDGKPVKSARLFAGYVHEQQVKRLAAHFYKPVAYYTTIKADPERVSQFSVCRKKRFEGLPGAGPIAFENRALNSYQTYEEAYHQLMADIIVQQFNSTSLVMTGKEKRIFVDGGFSKNPVYMRFLSQAFPRHEIVGATVTEATALGAALVFHAHWNTAPHPQGIVQTSPGI